MKIKFDRHSSPNLVNILAVKATITTDRKKNAMSINTNVMSQFDIIECFDVTSVKLVFGN